VRGVRKLAPEHVATLEDGKAYGVVATVGADGRPQTSIVWVDTDGENLVFNTTNARAKARNLRERPWVSVTVWANVDPTSYFEVQGVAELDEEGAADHIEKLSQRYDGHPFDRPVDRVIVRVRPERVFDHGIAE